jgi:ABC-type uncharacterized transport system substrate-binding protein
MKKRKKEVKMAKKLMVFLFTLMLCGGIYSQSLAQMGFIIKKAIPSVENIAVIFPGKSFIKAKIEREARPAILITKKKYTIFSVIAKSDLAQKISQIQKMDNVVVVVITDNTTLTPSAVQFIAQKTLEDQIPVISNRAKDTLQGALMSIFIEDAKIQKHINKIIASALGLEFSDAFLSECSIDAE